MKNQALFFRKDKSKKLKCRLLQSLFFRFKGKHLLTSAASLIQLV